MIANSGSGNVSVVDLEKRLLVANVQVGAHPGLARVSPDGKLAIVSNRGDNTISVVDLDQLSVRSTVAVCRSPEDVGIVPDSGKAFITCSGSNQVATVALESAAAPPQTSSPATRTRRAPPSTRPNNPRGDRLLALLDVGQTPVHVAVKPDGGEVFVSNFDSGSVAEITTSTNEVSSTHQLGSGPVRSLVSADNSLLYVSNFKSDSVAVYSIDNGKLVSTIHVGRNPEALAFTPDQHYLLVIDSGSGDVAVIRNDREINAYILFTMVPVGLEPRQIAVKAFVLRKPPIQ